MRRVRCSSRIPSVSSDHSLVEIFVDLRECPRRSELEPRRRATADYFLAALRGPERGGGGASAIVREGTEGCPR